MRKLILISNDDGINAPGLQILREGLQDLGEIYVVAPGNEMSGASHSITLGKAIEVECHGDNIYAVKGTPADCTLIALYGLLPRRPDLVVSGINLGLNLGEDVFYSGTVAAAREGAIYGIKALAVSIDVGDEVLWESALHYTREIVKKMLNGEIKARLLNMNVPNKTLWEIKGIKVVKLGTRSYKDPVEKLGERVYKIGGKPLWKLEEGTDLQAVEQGYVALTPLKVDLTDYEALHELEGGSVI